MKADSPKILVVANSYSPYWKASIDGQSAPVFPVDETFQGVYVQGGRHQVSLSYEPPYAFRDGNKHTNLRGFPIPYRVQKTFTIRGNVMPTNSAGKR